MKHIHKYKIWYISFVSGEISRRHRLVWLYFKIFDQNTTWWWTFMIMRPAVWKLVLFYNQSREGRGKGGITGWLVCRGAGEVWGLFSLRFKRMMVMMMVVVMVMVMVILYKGAGRYVGCSRYVRRGWWWDQWQEWLDLRLVAKPYFNYHAYW